MVRLTLLASIAVMALAAAPVTVIADSLIVDNLSQSTASVDTRPNRGMSMTTVESRWGVPLSKHNAIGDPPITRWEYPYFIVYFEYTNVIHAVQKN
ncbi:MAG: hypothetical protein E2O52_00480 [Gammaproteobacteria bacterium]|nr:MAG: hypothetical protein E2O52_00480 [Gammaproteobacteria bacterium]